MDGTKCQGRNCSVRESCYRYTSQANSLWQAWSGFDIITDVDQDTIQQCSHFWDNEDYK